MAENNFFNRIFEPKNRIPKEQRRFSDKMIWALIIPVVIEQALALLVGISDTFMVSYAGETAISGIALVTQIDNVFIVIFSALAAGGSVVISQYVGTRDKERGMRAAGQLLMVITLIGIVVAAFILIGADWIFAGLYGAVEQKVRDAGILYMRITACSFIFLGMYNACAGLQRSQGDTRTVMYVAMVMNVFNIVGNAIGIFVFKAGVVGVAIPSLAARVLSAVIMLVLVFKPVKLIYLRVKDIFTWDGAMIKRIFSIALPNSVENGLFMIAKLVISTVVATFGTVQIAAYGVAQSFWSMSAVFCLSMSTVFITVVGQYMGAGDIKGADYYMMKLLRIDIWGSVLWNVVIFGLSFLMISFYSVSPEAARLAIILVLIHNVFNGFIYSVSSGISSGVRAAGDARYSMVCTIISSVVVRVFMSIFLGAVCGFGVIGVAFGMVSEWIVKAILIWVRYKSGKWKSFKVI